MDRISWLAGRLRDGSFRRESTLQLQRPFGKTLGLTLLMFILVTGIAEIIVRSNTFQSILRDPEMGSRHYQLGRKLARLDAIVENSGPIDCLVIGSSIIDVGFDPRSFREGYKNADNQEIRCFNFGIDASTAASSAAIAKILVEDYQPSLLIYGTDARDFAVPSEDKDPAVILESSWIRYRLGDFTLDGWLLEHSYLYRYRFILSGLSRFALEDTLRSQTRLTFDIRSDGFTPLTTVATYINERPEPQDDSYEVTYNTHLFSSYKILEENLNALEKIMSFNEQGTQVIIIEMPVSEGLYYFFGNGKDDFKRFTTQVDQLANANQVPFWQTTTLDLIPDDGWSDYSHLNTTGAAIFSDWLGQQVSKMESDGIIILNGNKLK